MKRPKVVSTEIKRRAVERVAAGEAASRVAADLKINRQRIYEWQEQVRQGGLEALRGPGRPRKGALDGPPLRSASARPMPILPRFSGFALFPLRPPRRSPAGSRSSDR
jgi:transposase-like protein